MIVHRQQCQVCGSREHNVLLVRETGDPQVAIVRCAKCRALVARYELSDYYHHGRGYESWISSFTGVAESGRDLLQRFHEATERAVTQFQKAVAWLKSRGKDEERPF